jgi:hypothetical protein
LLKYAFNMIGNGPGQVGSLSTPHTAVVEANASAGLPLLGVQAATSKLQVTYLRRKASTAPGISYVVQFCDDLADGLWAPNGSATEGITSIDGTFERVTVTDSVTSTPRFVRVRVIANL